MPHPTPASVPFTADDVEAEVLRRGEPIQARRMVPGNRYSFDGFGDDGPGLVLVTSIGHDSGTMMVEGWWCYTGANDAAAETASMGGGGFGPTELVWRVQ